MCTSDAIRGDTRKIAQRRIANKIEQRLTRVDHGACLPRTSTHD